MKFSAGEIAWLVVGGCVAYLTLGLRGCVGYCVGFVLSKIIR